MENTYNFAGVLSDNINQPTKGFSIPVSECAKIHTAGGTECDLQLHVV